MANSYNNPMVIDTAAADVISHARRLLHTINWYGAADGADVVVQDAAGKVIWSCKAAGANFQTSRSWPALRPNAPAGLPIDGLKVPTLSSGKLELHFI